MQNQNKIALTVAFALLGAALLWFFAVTGWNNWSSQTTTSHGISSVLSILIGANWGYLYARGKSAAVQLCAISGGALGLLALSWGTVYCGAQEWIANGPSWHAAVMGFATFALAASLYFWCPPTRS